MLVREKGALFCNSVTTKPHAVRRKGCVRGGHRYRLPRVHQAKPKPLRQKVFPKVQNRWCSGKTTKGDGDASYDATPAMPSAFYHLLHLSRQYPKGSPSILAERSGKLRFTGWRCRSRIAERFAEKPFASQVMDYRPFSRYNSQHLKTSKLRITHQ